MKNILFFLTPKGDVVYTKTSQTVRQVLERFRSRGYTAIPMIDSDGHYIGTITEGDLLRFYLNHNSSMEEMENVRALDIPRRVNFETATISSNIEDLVQVSLKQNFVPVVDDNDIFIGIVTRHDIINYCYEELKKLSGGANS